MKKVLLGLGAAGITLAMIPLFAAFEAHVVNVTAKIENALNVPLDHLDFGTVFPQEKLDKFFDVRLSDSFRAEDRVDDVTYIIRQKPKCQLVSQNSVDLPEFGTVVEDEQGNFHCADEQHYDILPLLCPYLSKHEVTGDGTNDTEPGGATENDSAGIAAFHGLPGPWTMATTLATQVKGKLIKSAGDFLDTWLIDLKVPCFGNHCAQDWEQFVADNDGDNNAVAADYIQPIELEHQLFGCDLWLEVTGVSLPGLGCLEQADIMLVLDRSGSIGADMTTLKSAANAFVDALSLDGVHAGLATFSSDASLDVHLTNNTSTLHLAINALAASGTTWLEGGIQTATGELANPGDGHDRTDADSPDFMVIITDGQPNVCDSGGPIGCITAEAEAAAAADAARAAGIEVYVVGVGSQVDPTYLSTEIADDAAHYFSAAEFGDLEAILEGIAQCQQPV